MKFLIPLVGLIALALAGPLKSLNNDSASGFIVGGVAAKDGEVPSIVSVQRSSSHSCGGVILTNEWILTAAHCVTGVAASGLNVRYNTLTHASGGALVAVSLVIVHENYAASTLDNDVGLIKLASPLTLGQTNAQAAVLPAQGADVAYGDVKVSGWGTLAENGSALPPTLQLVTKPVISQANCVAAYSGVHPVTDNMFCAGQTTEGGLDACTGDSGGPAIEEGVLVGVVSWSIGCGRPQYPAVYARVSRYIDWFKSKGVAI